MNPAALRLTAALWPIAGVGLLLVILLVQGWPPAERATLRKLQTASTQGEAGAPARPISLPLHWDIHAPGQPGRTTLSLAFEAPAGDDKPLALFIVRLGNAWQIDLNGHRLDGGGELDQPNHRWAAKRPVWVVLPRALLTEHNRLDIHLRMDPGRRGGVSTVWLGPAADLLPLRQQQEWLRTTLPQAASVLSLLAAALCALLWVQQRDGLYAWAALGEFAWGLRLGDTWWEEAPLPWPAWGLALLGLFCVWSAAIYQTIRALWPRARPRGEVRATWAVVLGGPASFLLAWSLHSPTPVVAWMLIAVTYWLALDARLIWEVWRERDLTRGLMAVALGLCLLALARDVWAGRASALHYEESAWTKYAAISLALAVLAIVSLRFNRTRLALMRAHADMTARLQQQQAELNAHHAQLTALERAKAAAEERARILRDMHDGAGANLIAAIRLVQSGEADREHILQPLQQSLDQLRLTVDAMNLPPGDVNAVLSSLRYRLERRLQAAGLHLVWRVDELPVVERLSGSQMREIQFILLEAISNTIQHAQASVLTLKATALPQAIVLTLADDGCGWRNGQDPNATGGRAAGNGVRSMRERAERIGATLRWLPAERGTCMELRLPLQV